MINFYLARSTYCLAIISELNFDIWSSVIFTGSLMARTIFFESASTSLTGDKKLFNQYGVILVNPSHCPNAKLTQAKHFRDWLLSENGKKAISSHKVNGIQLFYPD